MTATRITSLKPNQIFVFGSNLAGRHGAGAALDAKKLFGAINGIGEGPQGQCYAIPTKDIHLQARFLHEIGNSVLIFLLHARAHPELEFLVTPIGTGLAGYSVEQIRPLFGDFVPENVKLLF